MDNVISIKGARQHNLKDIDLDIPKNKLVVFTGLSGSGKSSLAFDTIYAEGQRRYVESLSSYARQFLGIMDKPDVDSITGLSPAISIDQKSTSHNPRSTVGTVTEIYDYLRLLFARIGHPHCPDCGREISRQGVSQIVDQFFTHASSLPLSRKVARFLILSPVVRGRKGEFSGLFDNLKAKGFTQVRIDGYMYDLSEDIFLIKTNAHDIDVLVDRLTFDTASLRIVKTKRPEAVFASLRSRVHDAVEQSITLSDGLVAFGLVKDQSFDFPRKPKDIDMHLYSQKFSCPACNISIAEIEPRTFSFNSPHGACSACTGLGVTITVDPTLVLNPALSITEGGILPFAKTFFHDTWFSRVLLTIAEALGIEARLPLSNMNEKQKESLLYGTGDTIYSVWGENRFGEKTMIRETYEGIIPLLKRRYQESQSDYVRHEIEKYMREEVCSLCGGKRLHKDALTVTVGGIHIAAVTDMSIGSASVWSQKIFSELSSGSERTIGTPILKEIKTRLQFLTNVGLEYLTLSRSATSLSGGEAQRIRLASQIGSGLTGVLYVLDEPSIGLHQKDNKKLISTLEALRDLGNTVIVVEHDRDMILASDFLVDFGPGAGKHGGMVIAKGSPEEVQAEKKSLTATYLNGQRTITRPASKETEHDASAFQIIGARQHNLKNISVRFPLGKLICVTGVSGSGKSTLVVETLFRAIERSLNPASRLVPGRYERILGIEALDKVILIDQDAIGRTPRSNPATYIGLFTFIRDLYAQMPEAKLRGYKAGRFSFNIAGGRCDACEGEGQRKIEMQFLSDVYVTCEVCHGSRYNTETLEVSYHGKSIHDVLAMTVEEANTFFAHHPAIVQKTQTLADVGLGYIHLGQSAPTLSGGEAQRVKLAAELCKRSTGKTIYILDEPTTGLHFADLEKLLAVLDRLTRMGNTIIVIEHNLDIIRNADWIIDLGPEGGDRGGFVVAVGPPRVVANTKSSYTGAYLKNQEAK